jgi:hypothetical protein
MPVALKRRSDPAFDAYTDTNGPVSAPQNGDGESTSVLGEMTDEKTRLLGLPMPDGPGGMDGDEDRKLVWWDVRNVRRGMEVVPSFMWRGMWRRVVKSCILVAKASFFSLIIGRFPLF